MSINFLNWAIGAIVASITFLSPMSVSNHARTNEVVEEVELKGCATSFDDGLIQFVYNGSEYTKAEVEKPSNWIHDESEEANCNNQNVRACAIRVSPGYVDVTGPEPELESTISLTASPHAGGSYYISGSADTQMKAINKSTL